MFNQIISIYGKGILRISVLITLILIFGDCNATEHKGPQSEKKPKVVHLGPVTSNILGVTVRAGRVDYGHQKPYERKKDDALFMDDSKSHWITRKGKIIGSLVGKGYKIMMTFDRLMGEKLDTAWADRPTNYMIKSPEDPDYAKGLSPLMVFRKSRPTDLARIGTWKFKAPMEHILYLKLPKPLKKGKMYVCTFKGGKLSEQTFVYDPMKMRSEAVHISHIGFRPDDPSKVAFVSLWMGSGGPMVYKEGMKFRVLEDKIGQTVFEGEIKLSKHAYERNEDAYNRNYNGVNVYILDFSSLKKPGTYRVYLEGVGCSYPFKIEEDVWRKAFYTSVRGFYHQRSGIKLGPPHTTFKRPRSFHPEDGMKVYTSTTPLMDTPNGFLEGDDNFSKLVRGRTSKIVSNAWGGYCDAGDWDRRIQHLDVSKLLLELANLFPEYFEKFDLNIPESNDDLPDMVNEALWNIDFYKRLQAPDGGIRGGIESEGHPRYGEASWQESLTVMAYAPGLWSSYLYAGVAARAAFWLENRKPKRAKVYLESAVRAMKWAEKELKGSSSSNYPYQVNDARNLAGAELFRLTGEKKWYDIFLETTALKPPGTSIYKWKSHDQSDAAWVYYNTERPGMDESLKLKCKNAILREAEKRISAQQNTGFRWTKDPWRPAFAGTFTIPDCIHIVRAHAVSGEKRFLRAIILASQTGAGANPLNMCYTTGLGHKSPQHVLHIDSRITLQPPPPGLTVSGPIDIEIFGGWKYPYHKLAGQFCYPHAKDWPVIENYWDVFWYPLMCEFTVHQIMAPNAYVWGYLAARRGK